MDTILDPERLAQMGRELRQELASSNDWRATGFAGRRR